MIKCAFETTLRNSGRVLVRPVVPEDRHLLEIGFAHVSEASRYFRFLAPKSRLSDRDLDFFTTSHGDDHVAIGALDIDAEPPQPVGIARYIRLSDRRDAAEIAVTVVDDYQGLGLGCILIGALACHAASDGIMHFVALVHEDNRKMRHLFDELDAQVESDLGGEVEMRIPLHCDPAAYPDTKTGDAFRDVYRLAARDFGKYPG
ncbi:GNAT family N-acetyltransferase [Lentibacter sp. XHP0401]|uniref:GNAT family N-acetyltransferase n=1 Tax=Lentibacter sp. XHP0401 TaxID=2984334 RepID=UPI0021E8C372|nr:GNAT family protein [Lentibacter sp. XHP0401]MCV2892070.1 GNAT family N-acetyltransferase [Lentibacter sp. XHP0401]